MPESLGTMLGDILKAFVSKPATVKYPQSSGDVPKNMRGKVVYEADTCTGCRLCVRDCPAEAIDIIILDRKAQKFVMHYHADRCIFCAQCVESCRFGCIELSDQEWELAETSKTPYDIFYGAPEDVARVQAKHTDATDTIAE
jgi:NAD(P)H-quinone oxidoreductase subunit I